MPDQRKPNILFFFTDDQRFDTIRALGNAEIHTPNIDRLVERGTAFTHAHIPGGTSGAVCMPSRAMLHTGRTLFHIERQGQTIAPEHVMLGECLQAHGYRCFAAGKWHNGHESYARSFTDGGAIMFGGMGDHWNVKACDYDPTGQYEPQPWIDDPFHGKDVKFHRANHITCGKHSSELFCEEAIEFLSGYHDEAPLFMYISFMAPHDPRTMPKQYLDMYDPAAIPLPPNFMSEHPFDNGALRVRDEMLAPFPRTPDEVRRHIAEYYAMITHLDAQIGRVQAALDAKGMTDDTIIVFAGDNGLALGQHGLLGKQSNYDHSVRVPLVFAGPGVPAGAKSDAFAYLLDIFPTLCELADIPAPPTVEGTSLVRAMADPDEKLRNSVYCAYNELHRTVRDRQHKLIEYVVEGKRTTQLFDLQADPAETVNFADDPAHAETLARLRAELFRLRDEWDDRDSELGAIFWDAYEAAESS